MAQGNLEKRLAQLEQQVHEIQVTLESTGVAAKKDWRRAVEQYSGDSDLLAVFAQAQKLREADRQAARNAD